VCDFDVMLHFLSPFADVPLCACRQHQTSRRRAAGASGAAHLIDDAAVDSDDVDAANEDEGDDMEYDEDGEHVNQESNRRANDACDAKRRKASVAQDVRAVRQRALCLISVSASTYKRIQAASVFPTSIYQ
jgi:hypothetical protein